MLNLQEMEKKYLIKEKGTYEEVIRFITTAITEKTAVGPYFVKEMLQKNREYRYFDTFDGALEDKDLLAYVGPLEREGASASLRQRPEKNDYVLTVNFPTDNPEVRYEEDFRFNPGVDIYKVDPNDLVNMWSPLQKIIELGGNMPLQEVVRLTVDTTRFNLFRDDDHRLEVAVDYVKGKSPVGISREFHELEIEVRAKGENNDKEKAAAFFSDRYSSQLVYSRRPKWIKMLHLMRGQEILSENPPDQID